MICSSKAKRREENLGFKSDLTYWQQKANRQLKLEITTLHTLSANFTNNETSEEVMDIKGFEEMLGFLGTSFIGARMFAVIKKTPQSDTISLCDYLIYQDIVQHGTDQEKNMISFRMLDMSKSGQVTWKTYEEFWSNFLYMYGEMFNYKVEIDESNRESARSAFNVISQGGETFGFDMFEKARVEHPQLLEWIDEPENYIKQNTTHPDFIRYSDFQKYHKSVLAYVKELEE